MKYLTLSLILLAVASCADPLEQAYTEETFPEDMKELVEGKAVTTEQAELIAGQVLAAAFQEKTLVGKTYAQILADGEKAKAEREAQEAEEKRLAEAAAKEEAERTARLNQVLTVALFDKGFERISYSEYITFKFAFENKGAKDIKAFTGQLIINDLFDKEIITSELTYDDPIPAGQKVTWNAQRNFNEFIDEDVALKNKDLDALKCVWKPEKIIFADGTTLE